MDATTVGTRALQRMGIIADGERPEPSDLAIAERYARATHQLLITRRQAPWTWQDMPELAAMAYVLITSGMMAGEFGKAGELSMQDAALGQSMISNLNYVPPSLEPVQADYY